ncbi:hypothetical protein Tco_0272724 [Tanacetum coccineum]
MSNISDLYLRLSCKSELCECDVILSGDTEQTGRKKDEFDPNEFVHDDEQVNDDEDEEMTNSEIEESRNGDEEITDAAKVDAGNTEERHTADLIQKYSMKPVPEPSKIQTPTINLEPESEKSASEIRKIKKEQAEKQKIPKNPANHTLYHALMEVLIEDENAMDKGVADTVKNHKRQHDDDEDPSAGPNQGKKTKRRRTKDSESSMKPSTTKESSKGKALTKFFKTGKSATAQEPIKEPIAEVVMDDLETTANEDVVNDADRPQDYVTPKTKKPFKDTWFKQPPRPPTPDPEWN